MAAFSGDKRGVNTALARGDDVDGADDDGHTPVMMAAYAAHVDIVKVLLGAKASVHARSNAGDTALHRGCILEDPGSSKYC